MLELKNEVTRGQGVADLRCVNLAWARANLTRLEAEAQDGSPDKMSLLGLAHLELGNSNEAVKCCQRAFDQSRSYTNTRNLAVALFEADRIADGIDFLKANYQQFADRNERLTLAGLLVNVMKSQGRWTEACRIIEPFAEGKQTVPLWRGKDCKDLFFVCGGLGDFVLFSRYIPELQKRGVYPAIRLDKIKPLYEVFLKQPWCSVRDEDQRVAHDRVTHWTCGSNIFEFIGVDGTKPETVQNFPSQKWQADPELAARTRESLLQQAGGKRLVGICDQAAENELSEFAGIRCRSLTPRRTARLISSVPNVCWVNLHPQKLDLPGVLNPRNDSIEMLMALIDACDQIVSVDTFAAHLAGAMYKPVLALLNAHPYWYFYGQRQSVFYPTMELLGRTKSGLDGAIDEAITVLKQL
jgi:hypothetical protein